MKDIGLLFCINLNLMEKKILTNPAISSKLQRTYKVHIKTGVIAL